MARHKTPLAKAKMTGAYAKNPSRYDSRSEPDGGPALGKPPAYFNAAQKKIWTRFRSELPWLVESDRALVEVTTIVRAQIEAGGDHITAALLREHRAQLSSLGATPVTRSNVSAPGVPGDNDPFAQFTGGMN